MRQNKHPIRFLCRKDGRLTYLNWNEKVESLLEYQRKLLYNRENPWVALITLKPNIIGENIRNIDYNIKSLVENDIWYNKKIDTIELL